MGVGKNHPDGVLGMVWHKAMDADALGYPDPSNQACGDDEREESLTRGRTPGVRESHKLQRKQSGSDSHPRNIRSIE